MKKYIVLLLLLVPVVAYGWGVMILSGGGGGDSGAGQFTYIEGCSAVAASATVGCALTSIAADDVLVAFVSYESGSTATISSINDGGSNSLTVDDLEITGDVKGALAYLLVASANSSPTITSTLSTSKTQTIMVMQFRPAGGTIALDGGTPTTTTGTGTPAQSPNITTTGIYEIVVGMQRNYETDPTTVWQIDDTAADGHINGGGDGNFAMWYRILDATATDIHAQASPAADIWVAGIIAIKSS